MMVTRTEILTLVPLVVSRAPFRVPEVVVYTVKLERTKMRANGGLQGCLCESLLKKYGNKGK